MNDFFGGVFVCVLASVVVGFFCLVFTNNPLGQYLEDRRELIRYTEFYKDNPDDYLEKVLDYQDRVALGYDRLTDVQKTFVNNHKNILPNISLDAKIGGTDVNVGQIFQLIEIRDHERDCLIFKASSHEECLDYLKDHANLDNFYYIRCVYANRSEK